MDYYRIQTDPTKYSFRTFESKGETLAAQFFRPTNSGKGTVIVVHGYLDHSGSEANLINYLAEEGFHVAVYDQPGHGLSTGDRVSSGSFSTYRTAFSDFFKEVQESCPPPYHAVGHSMGGTIVADHLLHNEEAPLEHVVLVTPMIRDALPRALRRFGIVISPLVEYFPRIPQNNSSDEELGPRVMADPLQYRCVSSRASRSFAFWQHRSRNAVPSSWSPLVLNADLETVIDGEYSQDWMRRIFPQSRSVDIEGSRHQLLNEIEPLRDKVMKLIGEELGK